MFTLNAASERKLLNVQSSMQKLVRKAAEISDQEFQVVQGNRTQAEQDKLFAQGRTKPGHIVTWTRKSNHIGGRAIDYAALVNGKINWEKITLYESIASAFKRASLELGIPINWGGDWHTKDYGHIELQKPRKGHIA